MANSEERLNSVLATLQQCRTTLVKGGDIETAQVLSVAILQFRMKLNKVTDSELKALCDAIIDEETADMAQDSKSPGQRRIRPPLLKLVK